ncbi:MAG: glutathione S-transferase family protein [Halieaceae bacterium]|jgi:glutathione S-transferase|nr:glutathione S-transferase family protein [Halieaceae bacterium]
MKLYTFDIAPNPRRLGLFLQYKGIQLDTEQIDLGKQEHLENEAFGKLNPARTVPALVLDSGEVLTEVIGQCAYLESVYPEKPLMGTTALERADILSWDHKLYLQGFLPIAEIFRNGNPAFKDRALPGPLKLAQIPELCDRGELRLAAFWTMMDEHLAQHSWVAGDGFSLADIDLYCVVEFAGWIKKGIPDECEALKAWHARAAEQLG